MPLLRTVGKKDPTTKLVIWLIYFLLICGGVTMIYPFLIMLSGSFKSEVDFLDYDVIPRYFYCDEMLFRKYLESKYNNSIFEYNINSRKNEFSFEKISLPYSAKEEIPSVRISDFQEFLEKIKMPPTYSRLGHTLVGAVWRGRLPEMGRKYRKWIRKESNNCISTYNRKYDAVITSWLMVTYPYPTQGLLPRGEKLAGSKLEEAALRFKSEQPIRYYYYLSVDGYYANDFLFHRYGKKIENYNQAHGTNYKSFSEIYLSRTVPQKNKEREEWLEFVRERLNLQFIKVSPEAKYEFREFLRNRYKGKISVLNRTYGTEFKSFDDVPYPENLVVSSSELTDWDLFVRQVSAKYLTVVSPEFLWRDFLKHKYNNLDSLNQAHKANYTSFEKIPMPTSEWDYHNMLTHKNQLRWEFATQDYKKVIEYLLMYGKGIRNTVIFCVLSILTALIVNPLAAYAMSRFNLPSTYKILLFLLATMAFPPMVTTIPNFLLLKNLGLLNTFWALILPGMVNGFSIFLLKGFFDSLPRELYEAAMLDGANEWLLFWKITMNLSKPILAVIALGAFNAAYGAFMFALIVCPDPEMWTMMVWIYQLHFMAHGSVVLAALIIAAIPTLLVFVFCQKIIMRGIVVPIEK